ncbi:MAG: hypothetical protein HUJ76_08025 [Parasporobacterium sp.]|nr:hypothetical protein [Parasporobacterium sp.]
MNKMKKILSILVCAVLIFSLSVCAAAGPADPQGGDPSAAGESSGDPAEGGVSGEGESDGSEGGSGESSNEPTVTESAEMNPDAAITLDGVAMGQVRQLVTTASVVYDGGVIDTVHSTYAGTEEKDGCNYITITENDANGIIIRNTGSFVLGGESDPALVAEKINFSYITGECYPDWDKFCVSMGYPAGTELEAMAEDLVATGQSGRYTNLELKAPDTVVLNNYVIDSSGTGSNDMGGFGAAVYVSDNAAAVLNDFRIITRGPARGAVFSRFRGNITLNNSVIYAVSDPSLQTMQGCPPGLFIEGKVRATNAVGGSVATYNDSIVVSQGWGALSTDSDDLYTDPQYPTELHINNSYIAVLTSGYGAYSDGAARDYFKGSFIDVPDYAAVETGTGIVSFEGCTINAGMYGVMTHSGNSRGEIVFKDTVLRVGEAGVMLRDTANNVLFDNTTISYDGTYTIDKAAAEKYGVDMAELDAEFGTKDGAAEDYVHTVFRSDSSHCIAKLIHNSDSGSGTESTGQAPTVTIIASNMEGDILNTAAQEGDEHTATSGPAGEGVRSARSLKVVLESSVVNGAISLGKDTWETTYFASGSNTSQAIGYAASTELGAFHDEGYGLSLSLTKGSVWAVDETSYLTELVIDETSSVEGCPGAGIIMTVNGEVKEIKPGKYEGEIIITVERAE